MNWRAGLLHPTGLFLLLASSLLALAATAGVSWRGQEVWLFAWGIVVYTATASFVAWRERRAGRSTAALPVTQTAQTTDPVAGHGDKEFEQAVELALRHLSAPSILVISPLITWLARTLAAAWLESGKQTPPTPLEKARLLRSVLEASIERLKPASGDGESNQHIVLYEHYVLGKPPAYTMARHDMTERTFYRHQNHAISAVAADLIAQEAALAKE